MKKELKNNNITFSFNLRTHKVKVTLATKHCVGLYGQLAKLLGFGGGGDLKILKSKESPYVADLHCITSIYVYCNIVQPQIVGNTIVPLLRTIPVSGNSGDVITKTFTNIQYVPVQTKSFEDIEILLRTDTGDPVPFERGKVIATLYFRSISVSKMAAACSCSEEVPGKGDMDKRATVSAVCFAVLERSPNR